jgi:hypothetical protein
MSSFVLNYLIKVFDWRIINAGIYFLTTESHIGINVFSRQLSQHECIHIVPCHHQYPMVTVIYAWH